MRSLRLRNQYKKARKASETIARRNGKLTFIELSSKFEPTFDAGNSGIPHPITTPVVEVDSDDEVPEENTEDEIALVHDVVEVTSEEPSASKRSHRTVIEPTLMELKVVPELKKARVRAQRKHDTNHVIEKFNKVTKLVLLFDAFTNNNRGILSPSMCQN